VCVHVCACMHDTGLHQCMCACVNVFTYISI